MVVLLENDQEKDHINDHINDHKNDNSSDINHSYIKITRFHAKIGTTR